MPNPVCAKSMSYGQEGHGNDNYGLLCVNLRCRTTREKLAYGLFGDAQALGGFGLIAIAGLQSLDKQNFANFGEEVFNFKPRKGLRESGGERIVVLILVDDQVLWLNHVITGVEDGSL